MELTGNILVGSRSISGKIIMAQCGMRGTANILAPENISKISPRNQIKFTIFKWISQRFLKIFEEWAKITDLGSSNVGPNLYGEVLAIFPHSFSETTFWSFPGPASRSTASVFRLAELDDKLLMLSYFLLRLFSFFRGGNSHAQTDSLLN